MGKDNWTPCRAYLQSDPRTSPHRKGSQPSQTDFRRCQGEISRSPHS
ncbi:hypothetical protein AVEN_208818-1, partial [Araneus ventricosus]